MGLKQVGKRAQLFVGLEDSYGTPPSLTAGHAMRHISAQMNGDPKNRVFSPEKKAGPGRYARFDRRETADGSAEGLLRPSGTLNTLPECSAILEAAFGGKTNITLSTTVDTTSDVSGAVLASVTGLVAKTTAVQITCPDGKKRLRRVTTVDGGTKTITWAPALPSGQAPANGAAIKGATCFYLTAANAKSLFMARYNYESDFTAGLSEILKGWMADRLSLSFDYQDEPRFSVSGPAKTRTDAPSHPGGFTQVGTNPPTAITSECMVGTNAIKFMKAQVEITNGMEVRNDDPNATAPTDGYRVGDRDITVGFDCLADADEKTYLYDLALAGTNAGLFKQYSFTNGKLIAVYAPNVEWKPPTVDVGDGAVMLPFKGIALETVEDANDELVLMLG